MRQLAFALGRAADTHRDGLEEMELGRRAYRCLLEDRPGTTMSGQSAKRQKTSAMAVAGVPAIDSLPPELLDAIFGLLVVGTLCTARLVCAQFRGVAGRCIRSVKLSVETLRRKPEIALNNFPNLSQVTIFDVKEADLLMLVESPVAAAITHLRAVEYLRPVARRARNAAGSPLLPLPNLLSLTVGYKYDFTVKRAFAFPQTLRELALENPKLISFRALNLVAGLTNLTCLRIDLQYLHKPFEAVTALTTLQRLEICSELSVIPFVAELTLLTHLQFKVGLPSDLADLAPLARLHRLVHLGVKNIGAGLERQVISSAATFTGLRSLVLDPYSDPRPTAFETVCMTPFSELTALRLGHLGCTTSYLPRFNLERLRDLSLSPGVVLDRDGVAALRRATGLTQLELDCSACASEEFVEELGTALSLMSGLRALSLGETMRWHAPVCSKAIGLLTELTKLQLIGGRRTTSADAKVCLGLKKLRVLWVDVPDYTPTGSDRITPETFFAIAKLPELREFSIFGDVGISGRDLTDTVRAWLNADRHERGWPALEVRLPRE